MKTHWLLDTFLYLLGLCINITLLVLVVYFIYTGALRGFAFGGEFSENMTKERPDKEIEFVLEEDTPRAEVAQMLEELEIIANRHFFVLELFLKNSTKVFSAGTYVLNQNMSTAQVNIALRTSQAERLPDNVITIPEGYSVRDIAMLLEAREIVGAEEFIEAAANYHSQAFTFLDQIPDRPNKLEGYLFPDTYFLAPNSTPEMIIYRMLARFEEVFDYELRFRARELGVTMDEAVIIASMIEREIRVHAERPLVSRVIYNRLNSNMPLQIDATVLYALDKHIDRLTYADLDVDSPYNTYLYPGLPIGPIGNPGADCIRAALHPEDGNYVYYVLRNADTGEHYFTHDYDDFLRARDAYLATLD